MLLWRVCVFCTCARFLRACVRLLAGEKGGGGGGGGGGVDGEGE